jgi:phosphoglycerol transferase
VCLISLAAVFDLDKETLRWPFAYRGDTMFYHLVAKSVVDHGWFLDVPLLGTPSSLDMRDVPTSDNNLHVLVLRLLALGTSHYPLVLNGFYLLGFVLVFAAALAVLRHFGVSWWIGVCASLLFTYTPFHVHRGEHHLFLSASWQVPLAILLALWTCQRRPIPRWPALAICLALSAAGFYYAFFAAYLLVIAGLVAFSRSGEWRRLAVALGLAAMVCAGVVANLAPSVIRFQQQGAVPWLQRDPGDADTYGLRIAQLLLPVRGHVLEPLADLRDRYGRRPAVNENDDVSLGTVGALGFLGLLGWLIFRRPYANETPEGSDSALLSHLSVLTAAGLLLATMGGLGSVIAFLGLAYVRAYNRMGPFLAFLSLFAVALWADRAGRRFATSAVRVSAFRFAAGAATVLALFDQISPAALPDYRAARAQFASDQAFVRAIEAQVPPSAMIFQLPFVPFPEADVRAEAMKDYDLLRGYLHSARLRWSYGTVRGREGNSWLQQTAALPVELLVDRLAWAGFSGIYIDRHGFADGADALQRRLETALDAAPLYSADRELVFYNLTAHRARLEHATPSAQRAARRDAALNPPLVMWRDGFYGEERDALDSWRWARSRATLALVNRSRRAQDVRLRMLVTPNVGGTAVLRSPLFEKPIRVERNDPLVERKLMLPPGRHEIRFESDAPRLTPANDFRELAFQVRGLELQRGSAQP